MNKKRNNERATSKWEEPSSNWKGNLTEKQHTDKEMNAKPIMRQILESEELDLGFLRRYEDTTADDYKLVTAL